jgi:hypothetical protein
VTAGVEMSVTPDNYIVPLESCTSFPYGKSSLQGSSEGEDPDNGIQVQVVQRANSSGFLSSIYRLSEYTSNNKDYPNSIPIMGEAVADATSESLVGWDESSDAANHCMQDEVAHSEKRM